MRISQILLYLTLTLPLIFGSCDNEESLTVPAESEEMIPISLRIPDVEIGSQFVTESTRAVGEVKENGISNLYMVAVPRYITSTNPVRVISLSQPVSTNSSSSVYTVNLYPGDYKFYVVANLDRYLNDGSANKTLSQVVPNETNMDNLSLYFLPNVPLEPGHLPMACLPNQIKRNNSASWDGYFTINQNNNQELTAEMTYLCAKVRYTILFDRRAGGISQDFGSHSIRFYADDGNLPYVTNILKQTPVTSSYYTADFVDAGSEAGWSLDLDRYYFPNNSQSFDPRYNTLTPWDGTLDDWKETDSRAWQGIVYLPENMLSGESNLTTLHFPYEFDGHTDASRVKTVTLDLTNNDYQKGMRRGVCYDVVAKVVTPDEIPELEAEVSVSSWTEISVFGALTGQLEFTVDATKVAMTRDVPVTIGYSISNPAVSLSYITPRVEHYDERYGETYALDLYVFDIGDQSVTVSLNPELNDRDYETISIKLGDDRYRNNYLYFELVAGGLRKKIEVTDIIY